MRVGLLFAALLCGGDAYFLAPALRPRPAGTVAGTAGTFHAGSSRPPPVATPRVWQPRVLPPRMKMSAEEAYRTLGIDEAAGYDEILEQYEALEEKYAGDEDRLAVLESAKSAAVDVMLKKRMDGTMKATYGGEIAREDRPKPKKPPIWSSVNAYRKKLIEFPSAKYAFQVIGLLGGLSVAAWLSPQQAGGLLMLNTVSAAGFMYNRGEPEAVRDDMGQVGEIKPAKTKPLVLTIAITSACWFWGYYKAKALIKTKALEIALRTTLISAALVIPALFIKVHPIFD